MSPEPVLVGVDAQPQSSLAVDVGEALAGAFDRPLVLVAVYAVPRWRHRRERAEEGRRVVEALLARLDGDGIETRAVGAPSAPHGLHDAADEADASLVVLGASHRHGMARQLGGTAERLLAGAPCPVLVAASPLRPGGAIAVAYDATPESDAALAWAVELAERLDAPLALWHVTAATTVHPGEAAPAALGAHTRDVAEELLARGRERLGTDVEVTTQVLEGETGEEIARRAEADGATLVVCGSRGYGPTRTVLAGSGARGVVAHAGVPVVVVPRPAH